MLKWSFSPSRVVTLLENHSKFFTVKSIHSSELKEQGHNDDIKATAPQMPVPAHAPALTEFEGVHCCVHPGGAGQALRMETEERKRSLKSTEKFPTCLESWVSSRIQGFSCAFGRKEGELESVGLFLRVGLSFSLPHKPFVVSGPRYGCKCLTSLDIVISRNLSPLLEALSPETKSRLLILSSQGYYKAEKIWDHHC